MVTFIFLTISIFLSVINLLMAFNIKIRGGFYIIYTIKMFLVIFTGYSNGGFFNIKLILLSALVLEIILYGKLWKDLIFAIFIMLILGIVIVSNNQSFIDQGNNIIKYTLSDLFLLMIYPLFIIVLCSVIKLFEKQITDIKKIAERLKDGGTNLAETNISLQERIMTIENQAVESERKRVSREIHDIVGHTLMSIILMMKEVLQKNIQYPLDVEKLLTKTHDQAKEGLDETRKALTILKEKKILNIPLVNAVHRLIGVFQGTHVSIKVAFGNCPKDCGNNLNRIIYRFIQEGITNAIRHGNADEINIYFWLNEGILKIKIEDNGIGCKQFVPGIGLIGIEERMGQAQGRFETPDTTKGFVLIAYIPLKKDISGRIKN